MSVPAHRTDASPSRYGSALTTLATGARVSICQETTSGSERRPDPSCATTVTVCRPSLPLTVSPAVHGRGRLPSTTQVAVSGEVDPLAGVRTNRRIAARTFVTAGGPDSNRTVGTAPVGVGVGVEVGSVIAWTSGCR